MPARRDEIKVAADAGLRRMDIAEIVRAVDDPEFAVPGGEIQYLFFLGQNDQRGEPKLGMDGYDVLLSVRHDAGAIGGRGRLPRNARQQCSDHGKHSHEMTSYDS